METLIYLRDFHFFPFDKKWYSVLGEYEMTLEAEIDFEME